MITRIWMLVTADELELPLCIADNCGSLAKMVGKTESTLRKAKSYDTKIKFGTCRAYVRTVMEGEKEDITEYNKKYQRERRDYFRMHYKEKKRGIRK